MALPSRPLPESDGLPEVRVLAGSDEAAAAAAEDIASTLAAAIDERGVAHWATTGGSSAPPIYRRLGVPPLRDALDWHRVHVWFGDDRFVPYDHPLSNVLPFESILVAEDVGQSGYQIDVGSVAPRGVPIPGRQIHRWPIPDAIGSGGGPDAAAARYAEELRSEGPEPGPDGLPALDLVILGMGPDGHVLSVFPGSAVWDAQGWCAGVPAPTHVEPHVPRVTFHPALVAAARRVLLVSTGASKAGPLGRAWTGDDMRELPVRVTRRRNAVWILDEAAAAELPRG